MLQRGLSRSNPLMGLSFWRTGIIAAETADGAVSLVGSARSRAWAVAADRFAREIVLVFEGWFWRARGS